MKFSSSLRAVDFERQGNGDRSKVDDDLSLNSADFELAQETFHDERASRLGRRSRQNQKEDSIVDMLEFDNASSVKSIANIRHPVARTTTIRERTLKVKKKALHELASIKTTVKSSFMESTRANNSEYQKEIYDHMEDLRQERQELWCRRRKLPHNGLSNSEKRELRTWFRELDHDASGEVNADELQDPMISFGVLRTREQVVRLLNNIDRNKNTGIDFDEFLLALNSKDSANIQSLKRMQEAHSNVEGFAVTTLITAERRKKLFDSVVRASEKRNRELEFAVFRMNQHGNRRTDDVNSKTWSSLEAKHHRNKRLHNKYLESLNIVLQSKLKQMTLDSEREEAEKKREQQECAMLTSEKIRNLTKRDDCSLLKDSKLRRLVHYRRTRLVPDEYGGILKHNEPELPLITARNPYSRDTGSNSDTVESYDPLRYVTYADKSDGPTTLIAAGKGRMVRRPKLCSSLPEAPPMISLEKSEFSRNLRGPLSRAILDGSLDNV